MFRRMADIQILLTGDVTQETITPLLQQVTERVGRGGRSLLLALSTPGGGVYWGVTAYNVLRGLGIEIITHNVGQVDSIGGPIYAAGDRRRSVTHGRVLIHGVTWTFGGTNPAIDEKGLKSTVAQLDQERDRIASILADRSGKTLDEVRADMLAGTILTAPEAVAYGLTHEISDDIFDPAQEIINIGPA